MGDNYIKMDGEKDGFEGGAIRYTKHGKGRYDLIPGDVITYILNVAWHSFYCDGDMTTSQIDIIQSAYNNDNIELLCADTIINLVNYYYAENEECEDELGIESVQVTFKDFIHGFLLMLSSLAIHYENGADKYGVDNWKKGIPVIGGNRGGSFIDSGRRHLNQHLLGLTDEQHLISAIWNFVCALYTALHSNDTDKKEIDSFITKNLEDGLESNILSDEQRRIAEDIIKLLKNK